MSQGEKMLISITGFIGSGKDTVANYLTTNHGFKKESWAGSLKDAVSNVFGWDRELLEGTTKYSREWREEIDPWWSERLAIPHLTPRWILQQWGTDVAP
jgi:cytidylate kinase